MNKLDCSPVVELTNLFQAQQAYQHVVKQTTAAERVQKLQKLRQLILDFKDEIIEAAYQDFQKPAFETLAVEIFALVKKLDEACAKLPEWMQPEAVVASTNPAATAALWYEPRGVVLLIGPWNLPFLLCLSPLIPAIAAGNTAVLKPSELTPAVSAVIKKLIAVAFDEREVAVVEGGVAVTTELLKLPFDHIFFTGSPKVGRIVMAAAAQNLASVTLELGGKSPAIVDETANLEKAVARIMKGKTPNAGQVCMAPDYALVPTQLQATFISQAKQYVEKTYCQSGAFDYTDYGQIINQSNFDRLQGLFDDAIARGAKVALGGIFDAANRRIQPTILTDVPADAAIMGEEIFGPILPLIACDSPADAVAYVRQFPKPLAYYIFSESSERVDYLLRHSTSGGVCVNDTMVQVYEGNLPLGGVNGSGLGSYNSVYGFREFSHRRSIFYQSPATPVDTFRLPPYAGKVEKIWQLLTQPQAASS